MLSSTLAYRYQCDKQSPQLNLSVHIPLDIVQSKLAPNTAVKNRTVTNLILTHNSVRFLNLPDHFANLRIISERLVYFYDSKNNKKNTLFFFYSGVQILT